MSTIVLLDGSLKLDIFFDETAMDYEDDIGLCFVEDCPEDEKIFRADESTIYLTPKEAGLLVLELNRVLERYRELKGEI